MGEEGKIFMFIVGGENVGDSGDEKGDSWGRGWKWG